MDRSAAATRRAGSLAKTACLTCRRQKMKCIGASSPPCVRCSKFGRPCVVSTSDQNHLAPPSASSMTTIQNQTNLQSLPTAAALGGSSNDDVASPMAARRIPHRSGSNKPNGTASSPQSAILRGPWMSNLPTMYELTVPLGHQIAISGRGHSYGLTNSVALMSGLSYHTREPVADAGANLPNDEEACHLSRFFEMNLIEHVPVLTRLDISDLVTIVRTKRVLVYSMAYVAARFVPGCKAIRNALAPIIRSMILLQVGQIQGSDEQHWTLLQALAVLYTWASISQVEAQGDAELVFTMTQLKALIETLALRYSLHKSAEELLHILEHHARDLRQTFVLRKYTYWLWLFSTGYFHSLTSQTPPTMREDATVSMASQILQNLIHDGQMREILAPVELCLVWVEASQRGCGLGQWWCGSLTQVGVDSSLAILNDLDASLRGWRQKWTPNGNSPSLEDAPRIGRNCSIDIYYHYTRFCMSTYVTRLYQCSASPQSHMMSINKLVKQSVERARNLCNLLLKLTPLAKTSMAFSPEIMFAMIASCCDYLIYVYNYSADLEIWQPSQINALAETVELMIDLGVDERHSAKVYGWSILTRLQSARSGEPCKESSNASAPTIGQTRGIGTGSVDALCS